MGVGGVRRGRRVFGHEIVVGPAIDFELAPVPRQNLGLDPREGVGVADRKLDAVLFSGAGEDFEDNGPAGRYFEPPFPGWFEGDCARRRRESLGLE